jgi:hypothetical protein
MSPHNKTKWLTIVVLCCLIAVINSIDRTAMSIAILPMSRMYQWSDTTKGVIQASFNAGEWQRLTKICSLLMADNHDQGT